MMTGIFLCCSLERGYSDPVFLFPYEIFITYFITEVYGRIQFVLWSLQNGVCRCVDIQRVVMLRYPFVVD